MRSKRGLVIGAELGLIIGGMISTTAMVGIGLVGALVGMVLLGRQPGGDRSELMGYDAEDATDASFGWFGGGGDDGDDGGGGDD